MSNTVCRVWGHGKLDILRVVRSKGRTLNTFYHLPQHYRSEQMRAVDRGPYHSVRKVQVKFDHPENMIHKK